MAREGQGYLCLRHDMMMMMMMIILSVSKSINFTLQYLFKVLIDSWELSCFYLSVWFLFNLFFCLCAFILDVVWSPN